jgi:hypothetical protein
MYEAIHISAVTFAAKKQLYARKFSLSEPNVYSKSCDLLILAMNNADYSTRAQFDFVKVYFTVHDYEYTTPLHCVESLIRQYTHDTITGKPIEISLSELVGTPPYCSASKALLYVYYHNGVEVYQEGDETHLHAIEMIPFDETPFKGEVDIEDNKEDYFSASFDYDEGAQVFDRQVYRWSFNIEMGEFLQMGISPNDDDDQEDDEEEDE